MILFDTHAHLDGEEYATDREEMIRAHPEWFHIVNVGFNLESSAGRSGWREEYDLIYAAVGIHPHDAAEAAGITWKS